MNVKVEVQTEEAWRRVLAIEVPADEVEKEYERVAKRIAKKVRLPGFRKGKVPVAVVRKSFKKELDEEFLETIVPRAFGEALDETGLDPVTEPKFEDLSFGAERPLSFTADFECRPEIEVTGYQGIAGEKQIPEVTSEHVDDILEDFRKRQAELEDVDRPAIDQDVVTVDYHAVDANGKPIPKRQVKDYAVELGAGRVVADFENAIRGSTPGSVHEADIPYPEDHPDEFLAGTTAHYRIKVKSVQEKRFPELTDALVAANSNYKDVEELRAKVREDLEEQADRAGVERLESVLMEKVIDANPFDPPQALVDGLLDDLVERQKYEAAQQGQDPDAVDAEAIRSSNRDGAARQVRRSLLMDSIARQEEIRVEAKELQERIAQIAAVQRVTPRKLVTEMGGDRFLRRVSRQMRDKKVLAFLVQNAEITEKKVPVEPRKTEEERS